MVLQDKRRAFLRRLYHGLPISQQKKWRLRERLTPLLSALNQGASLSNVARGVGTALRTIWSDQVSLRDNGREIALARILEVIAAHAQLHGPVRHWIALPFFSTGGAELFAVNICRALRELQPGQSIMLLVTDRKMVTDRIWIPPGVLLLVLDDYLAKDNSYQRKQPLLRELLIAVRPECFHVVNSEVAWHLIMQEGERLARYTRLYASIFAFQFTPDGQKKIGYAAYFLKKSLPYISGLLTDNKRFVDQAVLEYGLTPNDRSRMTILYQPCRLLGSEIDAFGRARLIRRRNLLTSGQWYSTRRPQVLWAGRLDAEKRIGLFLEVVRRCTFADFRVYGQVVLGDGEVLPQLPNLTYEGAFSSPLEWLEKYDFDAFMFTSRWEGMPNILIEVGSLCIPVIAPLVGGVGELIGDDTGYPLSEQPTAANYEQALRSLIEQPGKAIEKTERLLALVCQRHSWGNFTEAVSSVPGYISTGECNYNNYQQGAKKVSGNCLSDDKTDIPLVSVIIPCYNQGKYLHESVSSSLSACSHPMEIIVIDDGSTDVKMSRHLEEAQRLNPVMVRIHRQENSGLSGARNIGINLARGKFLQFLDADDLLSPGKIDAQIAQFQVNPDLSISVCNFLLCDDIRSHFTKNEEAIANFDLTEKDFLYLWERGFAIPIHCGLFRRNLLDEVRFDVDLPAKEDWVFWTSLVLKGLKIGYVHGHWAIYRQHNGSMRRSYVNMGRAWLQAGLKIDAMVADRERLFFESIVSWFERSYRSHPEYRNEIARLQASTDVKHTLKTTNNVELVYDPLDKNQIQYISEEILRSLDRLTNCEFPPLISVIVPIYGHFEHLQCCLESLSTQGDVPIEVVCVNDGSPDPRVAQLMRALQGKNLHLKIHSEPTNRGISWAQNYAVNLSQGEFVAFLDCDDLLVPYALQTIRSHIESYPGIDYFFTDRFDIDKSGSTLRLSRYGGYENIRFSGQDHIQEDLVDGMVASHLKVIRRRVYLDFGGCDPAFAGVQDWELALRIAREHELYYIDRPLYLHRVHGNSVTTSDKISQFRKTNQVRRKHLESWRHFPNKTTEVFYLAGAPLSLNRLKSAWKKGDLCIADARCDLNLGQINFLREFNSYFDQILWSDPVVPAALFGYLCKEVKLTWVPLAQ